MGLPLVFRPRCLIQLDGPLMFKDRHCARGLSIKYSPFQSTSSISYNNHQTKQIFTCRRYYHNVTPKHNVRLSVATLHTATSLVTAESVGLLPPSHPTPVGRSRRREEKEASLLIRTVKDVSLIGTLYKWRLSVWVALSTIPGYLLSSGAIPTSSVFMALAVGTFLCSGGANTFNQVIERDRDALMSRTRTRPLPSGRVTIDWAMKVGSIGSVAGVGILLAGTNPTTALLGALNIGLYAMVYTPLKTITPYNVHIGSIVGSIPTVMGCTAAGASLLTPDPWMLFAIQTLWQFPHFYGLAWRYRQDYLNGGFKSFPLSDVTGHQTAQMMKPYIVATALIPFITASLHITNMMFVIDGTILNYFLWDSFRKFQNDPSIQTSRQFFGVSLWHLLIFLTLAVFHSRSLHSTPSSVAGSQPNFNQSDQLRSTSSPATLHRCPWTGIKRETQPSASHSDHNLHYRIESLRELVEEFCIHKRFTGLDYNKEFCIFDRVAKLAPVTTSRNV